MRIEKKQYEIIINANCKKVWFALWDIANYKQWTSVFCQGSHVKTNNWEKGSRVHFLDPIGNGMYSDIVENIYLKCMDFVHVGNIKNFEEQPIDEETKLWTQSHEKYTLEDNGTYTLLKVDVDTLEQYVDFFEINFPKALAILKNIAEDFMIKTSVEINLCLENVWNKFSKAEHIVHWQFASDDWHCPSAELYFENNGSFNYRMEAKDNSFGFNLKGNFEEINIFSKIDYILEDNRRVKVTFDEREGFCIVNQYFEPENENPYEMQKFGWQSILNNFKSYCEKTTTIKS